MKYLSYLSLVVVLLAPILHFADVLSHGQMSTTLLVGTVLWFATAATWINAEEEPEIQTESSI